jgi:hypothetical protein
MTRIFSFLCIVAMAWAQSTEAQMGASLHGTVIDRATSRPVAGAVVVARGAGAQVMTDSNGAFTIRSLTPGFYVFAVSRLGYRMTVTDTIEVGDGAPIQLQVRMDALREEELRVIGQRRRTEVVAQEPCGLRAGAAVHEWYRLSGRITIAALAGRVVLPDALDPVDNGQLCQYLVGASIGHLVQYAPDWWDRPDRSRPTWAAVAWTFAGLPDVIIAEGVEHELSLTGGPGGPREGVPRVFVVFDASTLRVLGHERW